MAETTSVDAGKAADAAAAAAKPGAAKPGADKPGQQTAKVETGQKPGTILDGSVEQVRDETLRDEGGDKAPAQTWPDDWREQMSGGDDKALALLKRYGSPQAVTTALKNLRGRLDAGEFKKALAPDATEDEIKAFNKENGIPETAAGYKLPEGLKIGEADQPIIDGFFQFAHDKHYTPAQVAGTVGWYYRALDEQNAQMFENDRDYRREQEDGLRQEWGPEFRGNINGLTGFMEHTFGADTKEADGTIVPGLATLIMGARLGDGSLAGNNAKFLKAMVGLMKEIDPEQTLTSGGQAGSGKGVEERIAEIEKFMTANRDAYFKDERMQTEYRDLIGTREKLAERNKGRKAA